ncbi:DNA-directed RNA polymerase III subunit RPC8 [Tanacetum coccineum]
MQINGDRMGLLAPGFESETNLRRKDEYECYEIIVEKIERERKFSGEVAELVLYLYSLVWLVNRGGPAWYFSDMPPLYLKSESVKFRLIIFPPYVGEIVSAKLKESNRNVTLGFFDDIYIPELLMREPSISSMTRTTSKNQGTWTWDFNDEEYFIDGQDEIRFRVQNVKFPEIPKEHIGTKPFAPMEITGPLVSDGGLGPVLWWV